MQSVLEVWFKQVKRYPCLTAEQHIELGNRVQNGTTGNGLTDDAINAVQKLVKHNLRLCAAIWQKSYSHYIHSDSDNLQDLLQEGCVGLRRAAELYDPKRGYTFATYAFWWIRRYMNEYLYHYKRVIKIPSEAQMVYNQYSTLSYKHNSREAIELVASQRKLSRERVEGYIKSISQVKTVMDQDVLTIHASSDQPDLFEDWSAMFDLIASRAELDPQDRELLLGKYSGMSFETMQRRWPEISHIQKRYTSARWRFVKAARELAGKENLKAFSVAHNFEVA